MSTSTIDLKNTVQLLLRSGDTGEELFRYEDHNDISDDITVFARRLYAATRNLGAAGNPYCFLLKDGPDWTGFTWDRKNPQAPYCAAANNLYNGAYDTNADPHWTSRVAGATWNATEKRHKLFFTWTKLAEDLSVKALGLTGWDDHWIPNFPVCMGIDTSKTTVFVPQTLITLPAPILVRGRRGGTQIPDILEVSYYLSAVGVN